MRVPMGYAAYLARDGRVIFTKGRYRSVERRGRGPVCGRHCIRYACRFDHPVDRHFDGDSVDETGLWLCSEGHTVDLTADVCTDGNHVSLCSLADTDRCRDCNPGKRGQVLPYQSTDSRRRMLEKLVSLGFLFEGGNMMTLTYGRDYPDPVTAKRHLDTFGKRFVREFGRDVPLFWVCECQERGAIHFHVIVGGQVSKNDLLTWAPSAWIDITGYGGSDPSWRWKKAVDVTSLYGMGGFLGYLSKEVGKRHQKRTVDGKTLGRWWGLINCGDAVPDDPIEDVLTREQVARLMAVNDLWKTWGWFLNSDTGRVVDVMRTLWTGDVADWIIFGIGSLRGPPDRLVKS